jgi:hypothetical protein
VAREMTSQAVSNTVWGFATLKWELGGETWVGLAFSRYFAVKIPVYGPCNQSDTPRECQPYDWDELEAAVIRVGPQDMNAQEVANTTWWGLYSIDPALETAWFQPLNVKR